MENITLKSFCPGTRKFLSSSLVISAIHPHSLVMHSPLVLEVQHIGVNREVWHVRVNREVQHVGVKGGNTACRDMSRWFGAHYRVHCHWL